ncbi:MAG: CotH kinase family protein [Prevotella sp.]|nr:CotH kinase family protein [Prevotella sp.]
MKTRFYFITLLFVLTISTARAQVIITELMQSNIDCVMDDLNEFPDSWVELYNSGSTEVDLSKYRLGVTNDAEKAWQLGYILLQPQQYILVYCDKQATSMHTDYRLESGKGCAVYLFKDGAVVDQITGLKKQPAPNISYGRQSANSDQYGYQAVPTPGAANCGTVLSNKDILGNPVFSEQGRVVQSGSLTLELSLPNGTPEGAKIYYTTNGSEPTPNDTQYTSPLTINKSTVVRAKIFCDGYLSPRSATQSYLFHSRNITLPVISIATDDKYLNDPKIGIYVDGNYSTQQKNYEYDWRRPINFEYFEGEGQESKLNQLCETRIQGGATRGNKLKSLAIYAHKRFGTKRFNYEFFPDQRPGDTDFKSLVLRNSGNDFDYLYQRDAIIQRSMAERVDLDWQAWSPAIIYINGVYRGMLNIRERSNEDNIYTHYEGEDGDGLEDIDMIENWYELKEGDTENFNRFTAYYTAHGHTMAEYEQWMDCREFMNLMIMNLYFNNQDFPGNNIVMWRPRTENGRWRWIAKDTDFGLGLYGSSANYKTLEWLHNPNYDSGRTWANQSSHTRLFRRLMEDADFKREFLDRAAIYMGDFLNEQGVREIWDPMYQKIQYEYPYHRALINQWWPNYGEELNNARNWLKQRTNYCYQHIGNFYQLGSPIKMRVNKEVSAADLEGVSISFNGLTLTKGVFDGQFYADRQVTLQATSSADRTVVGWTVQTTTSSGTTTTDIWGDSYTFAMPQCNSLNINVKLASPDGIETVRTKTWNWLADKGTLTLRQLPEGARVVVYDLQGIIVRQTVASTGELRLSLPANRTYLVRMGDEVVKIRL